MTNQKPNPKTIQTKKWPALQATPIALASLLCLAAHAPSALAQAALERQGAAPDVATIVVTESRSARAENLTGFGDVPLREIPQSVVVLTSKDIADKGLLRLSDLTKLDPSTTESYNAVGYWDFLEVRGVLLDNLYNYRREGLPISAETSIPLDNKESVEILKGTSGMQAGQSTAGGLVNYTVKRPTNKDLRTVRFEMTPRGGTLAGLDVGGRFGEDKNMGYRFNAVHETLRPALYSAEGRRDLLSLAMDKRISANTLLEGEIEVSKRTQPSQAAFSVLANVAGTGYVLPDPVNAKINLNNQPWSQPVVMGATTSTIKLTQVLSDNWTLTGQVGMQQLRTDDRSAYASGCGTNPADPLAYGPSFCNDGTFNLFNFSSRGEKRQLDSGKLALKGKLQLGYLEHNITAEHLRSHTSTRLNAYAWNFPVSGTGNIAGTGVTVPDLSETYANANRNDRASEWMLTDAIAWGKWRAFAGLRLSQIKRSSVATDASTSSAYSQSLTTPWMGVSYALASTQLYASAGQGVELPVVPTYATYANSGMVLPVTKSHQVELGARGGDKITNWSLAYFGITRPTMWDDGIYNYRIDGIAKHRGIEAQIQHTMGPLKLAASTMLMKAVREDSTTAAYNGMKPTNVPSNTLRLQSNYKIEGTGWDVQNVWVRDGARAVTPTNDVMLPAWSRWDLALGYQDSVMGKAAKYRVGIDNVTDKRYWKGSPTQFGNYFLYPGAPRTIRFTAQLDF
jgi:iron complex outermembrane recepter protein